MGFCCESLVAQCDRVDDEENKVDKRTLSIYLKTCLAKHGARWWNSTSARDVVPIKSKKQLPRKIV